MYQVTKTYGHEQGFSCCFRQWKAKESHCRFIHGYALSIKLTFQATNLDERNWVIDFGGFKEIKEWIQRHYDHKMIVAVDDPHRDYFQMLANVDTVSIIYLDAVGCEAFAYHIGSYVVDWLEQTYQDRVKLVSCQVMEHPGNSAIYLPE